MLELLKANTKWERIQYGKCFRCSRPSTWLRIKQYARGAIQFTTYCDVHGRTEDTASRLCPSQTPELANRVQVKPEKADV